MHENMKIWIGQKVVGSVSTDGTILDTTGSMVGHIYLYTGEVSVGDAVAGDKVVGSVSHEGDIYDESGKIGDIARSGNIWDANGCKAGWVAPLQYWKSAITLYESYDAPVLLAGGAALLLVFKRSGSVEKDAPQRYPQTIPLMTHSLWTTADLVCS